MSLFESVAGAVRDGACQILDNLADGVDFTRNFLNPVLGDPGEGSIINDDGSLLTTLPFINVSRGLGALLCNRTPDPPPPPQFPGGQCDGIRYRVTYQVTAWGGQACVEDTGPVNDVVLWGPVLAVYQTNSDQFFNCGTGFRQRAAVCRGIASGPGSGPILPSPTEVIFSSQSRANEISLNVLSVTRVDGLPDDCGDSPLLPVPAPTPGYPNITNNNFTFVDDNGVDVTIPLALVYLRPTFDVDNNFRIPVRIDLGGIEFDGSVGPDGEVDINPRVPGRPGLPGRNPTQPQPVEPAPDPDPDSRTPEPDPPDDPDTEQVIIGAVVTVNQNLSGVPTQIVQTENPDIYAPNLGFINFLYQVDTKRAAWGVDIPVKNLNQLIPVDWPYGAIDVKGTPRPGVTWTITAVYDTGRSYQPIEPIPTGA